MLCPVLKLAMQLIHLPSISPHDCGCQKIIINKLKNLDFNIECMSFKETKNLWAWHGKKNDKTLILAGHTDVVPPGNLKKWNSPPFIPICKNGILYGRGSVDMKGALAAMIIAAERFIIKNPYHKNRLAFLITSDEEAKAEHGTVKVIENLIKRKEKLNYCIIGEPSSNRQLGDIIKYGRRGSLNADLTVYGNQEHVAYTKNNLLHIVLRMLNELIYIKLDKGNKFFPPTTIQITDICTNNNIYNITPEKINLKFNFRFNTSIPDKIIKEKINTLIKKYNLNYRINWYLSGLPYITKSGKLINTTINSIKKYKKIKPSLQTSGGTSDGRFIIKAVSQIVELGLINDTIHKANECVNIADLNLLSLIYQDIIEKLI